MIPSNYGLKPSNPSPPCSLFLRINELLRYGMRLLTSYMHVDVNIYYRLMIKLYYIIHMYKNTERIY